MAQRVSKLPRGKFFLAGATFSQILTKTLPGLLQSWEDLGWARDVDFVLWRRPAKGWILPFSPPEKFSNVISFKNGGCIELLSLDRPDLSRGGSYDGGDIDEAALLNQEDWMQIILPSVRGNVQHFFSWLHQNVCMYSSVPRKPSGYWLLEYEQKSVDFPDEYFWLEGNAYDNIEILTEKGIERMRREMKHLEFEMEVMNRRIQRAERAFYSKFDPSRHTKVFHYDYTFNDVGHVVKGYKDLNKNAPIDVSFDFGGWFTCCTVSQYDPKAHVERFYKEFFRDGEDMLRPIISELCHHFEANGQKTKVAKVYGEPRGWDPRSDAPRSYENVQKYFSDCGWGTDIKVKRGEKTDDHAFRFEFINDFFSEDKSKPRIEINEDGCPNLTIVLQTTAIKADSTKDKSKETDRKYPQRLAPHLSDTFDYKLCQKYMILENSMRRASSAGAI